MQTLENEFIEVDGVKYVPDETDPTQPQKGDDGTFVEFVETPAQGDPPAPKQTESPEAKQSRLKRELKQHEKKHDFTSSLGTTKTKEKVEKSSELDYGKLAYLKAHGIETDAEIELAEQTVEESGKSLKEVLETNFFKGELKALRADAKTAEATPKGKRRPSSQVQGDVDFHYKKYLATGELPEDREMKRLVLEKRVDKEKDKSQFTEHGVAGDTIK